MSTKHLACDPCHQSDAPAAPHGSMGALPATGRLARVPLPEAAQRLRLMFPEVWARYQAALAAARQLESGTPQ